MRCACIDIGSNTTRLLVAEAPGGQLQRVLEERRFTRIGQRIDAEGAIPEDTIAAVAEVVAAQRSRAIRAGASHVRAVATAAIRAAANKDELVAALRERAGVEVAVLSGEDEARLAFAGATRTLERPPEGTVAVVDVGGLSTEIAVGSLAGGVIWMRSFPVGSALLSGRCRADPPSDTDLETMRETAAAAFAPADLPRADHAVAVGGSAASLPTLVGPVLDRAALERALRRLRAGPAAAVARRHGLAPERIELLPAGILVLGAAAQRLGLPLTIASGGLREGVILELVAAS
jgi:exopolyphosphatase/guanosine-5'-triphosphate,3'-diphosphate pyrophosphatase